MESNVVYSTLESVLKVFENEKYISDNDVIELLQIYKKAKSNACTAVKRYPLIVLEGLDLSGKTTITRKLAKRLNAHAMKSPPTCISAELRQAFDDRIDLKTAFYSLGNYILGYELLAVLQHEPVVLDRFWHSTAANGFARSKHYLKIDLPPKGDERYYWPADLVIPDIVLLLKVSENVRLERAARREVCTDEENLLKNNPTFRQNVIMAYENMEKPSIQIINSDLYVNKVLKNIMEVVTPIMST